MTGSTETSIYGSAIPALTFTDTGAVAGGTTPAFTGSLTTTATPSSSIGNYPITQGSLAATGNYTIGIFNPGVLAIGGATPKITVSDPGGVYNGLPYTATATVTGLNNTALTTPAVVFSYFLASDTSFQHQLASAPTNVGSYLVIAVYQGNSGYIAVGAATTFSITQATPTITVSDAGGVYNGSPFTAQSTVTGVAGANLGTPVFSYFQASDTSFQHQLAGAPTSVGNYVVIAVYPGSANYIAVGVSKYFSITEATSVLMPVATTVAYGGTTTLATTLLTSGGVPLAGRTVTFTLNGKSVGTAVTNSAGVATLGASVAGITPGVYSAGLGVSYAGDGNSTAASATASLTVLDAPITTNISASALLNVASLTGSFTQARTGAAASDFIATINWGDGTTQQVQVVADLLHPGQFDLVGASHVYLQLFKTYTVTLTVSTVGKFGAAAGATTTFTTSLTA